MSAEIDPLLIATDGIVGSNGTSPFHMSVLGITPFISITVLDPIVSGGGIGHRNINSETILVSYKGKTVEYNKSKDKNKLLFHMTINFNDKPVSKMFLVDATKSSIIIEISNIVNKINKIIVSIKDIKLRKISIKGLFGSSDK